MAVITTLNFAGRTEEALDYYTDTFGAETVFLMRFRDCPDPSLTPPGMGDRIFHATFRIDNTEFMASDVGCGDGSLSEFTGFALALRMESIDRARRVYDALANGGKIVIPLAEASFTAWYGIVMDRFGVSWKLNVSRADE